MKILRTRNKSLHHKNQKKKKMNKLEKIYKEIRVKDDIEKTSIICSNLFFQTDFNFRVFISIQIPVFTDYDPYKNESLVMTLNMEKDGQIEKWLELKKSSINDGGFGVFAAREFSANEFVTVYLGKKYDVTYRFGDILALPSNFKPNGFQEEYWFGHRINHASGKRNNLVITDLNVLRATKTIKAGDELFWDYNRDCFCRVCRKDSFFLTQEISTYSKCSHCGESKRCYKVCETCSNFMCPKCYDNFQIKL
jgi:hypothetical protein